MAKGYILRGQGIGLLTDKIWMNGRPTKGDVEEALKRELHLHGLDKDGKPRDRWVRVVEIEVVEVTSPGNAPEQTSARLSDTDAEILRKGRIADPAAGTIKASPGDIVGGGTARVINPGERETIGPEDVGTLKL